jgi:hypothetical protein
MASFVRTNYNKTFVIDATTIKGTLTKANTPIFRAGSDPFSINLKTKTTGFFTTYNRDGSVANTFDAQTITMSRSVSNHSSKVPGSVGEFIITCVNADDSTKLIYICYCMISTNVTMNNDLTNLLSASPIPSYMNISTFLPTSDNGFYSDATNQVFLSTIPIVVGNGSIDSSSFKPTNETILKTTNVGDSILYPPTSAGTSTGAGTSASSSSSSGTSATSVLDGTNTFICDTSDIKDPSANSIYQTTTAYINQKSTNDTLRALIFFVFFIITAVSCYAIVPIFYQKTIAYLLKGTDAPGETNIKKKRLDFVRGFDTVFSAIFIVLILILLPLGLFGESIPNRGNMDLMKITIAGFSLMLIYIFSYIAIQLNKFNINWPEKDMDFTDDEDLKLIEGTGVCISEVFNRIQRKIEKSD